MIRYLTKVSMSMVYLLDRWIACLTIVYVCLHVKEKTEKEKRGYGQPTKAYEHVHGLDT